MAKKRNDNREGEKGNYYRTLVAVNYIFKLDDFNVVTIEHNGDVTFDDKVQIEVKHHKNKVSLGDHHIDFWKTLYNWIVDTTQTYERLIFHTTSSLPQHGKSVFIGWEHLTGEERYQRLNCLGLNKREIENPYWKEIFLVTTKERVVSVLSKVELSLNNSIDTDYIKEIASLNYFFCVKVESSRIEFVKQLVSEINKLVVGDQRWETSKDNFQNMFSLKMKNFIEAVPVDLCFNEYLDRNPEENDIVSYYDHRFVMEIKEIGCMEVEVIDTITDVWKTNGVMAMSIAIDPLFRNEYKSYKKNKIHRKLKAERMALIKTGNEDKDKTTSLEFYRKTRTWDAIAYMSIRSDYDFFMHGTIQHVVEDPTLDFSWLI